MALIPDVSPGDPGEASWANAIRDQTIQVTTSGARPGSPSEGMVIYQTDTHEFAVFDGSDWVIFGGPAEPNPWTPTVTQGSSRVGFTDHGRYQQLGNHVTGELLWTSGVTGSAAGLFVGPPTGLTPYGVSLNNVVVGTAMIYEPSASQWKGLYAVVATTSGLAFRANGAADGGFYATALESGTRLAVNVSYFI